MWLTRNPADAEAEARLAAFGLHVSVPASDDHEQIELVDVRSCDYDGGPMAHLLYEVEGQSFSLFVIPEARHAEGTLEVLGHQERLWSNDREACVLVGPEDAVAMDKVAAMFEARRGRLGHSTERQRQQRRLAYARPASGCSKCSPTLNIDTSPTRCP